MYVLVRCKDAGVHCGYLERQTRDHIILTDARRIWRWFGASCLSEIAVHGLNPSKSKDSRIGDSVTRIQLRQSDVCEVIEMHKAGRECIQGFASWRA
jgi:hypothetical protein